MKAHDLLGWVATAVFVASYFLPKQKVLPMVQAAAACLWIVYGVIIGALPVIVANILVACAAAFSVLRSSQGSEVSTK